jgi:superoxide dismutase
LHEVGNVAGFIPVLVMDVWEHAFLLDYKAERPKYIEAFFSNLNWQTVEERLSAFVSTSAGVRTERRAAPPPTPRQRREYE